MRVRDFDDDPFDQQWQPPKVPIVCLCGARLNEWCVTRRGKQRDDHLVRLIYMRLWHWWKSRDVS